MFAGVRRIISVGDRHPELFRAREIPWYVATDEDVPDLDSELLPALDS